MTDSGTRERIRFPLEQDDDGYPPAADEYLWAERIADGVYRLDNIPFFVRGVSLGDEVAVEARGNELVYAKKVRFGGHRTIRLLVSDETSVDQVRAALRAIGCSSELSHIPFLVSVDAPPSVEEGVIRRFLDDGMARGDFEYEEGCIDWRT